MSLSRLVRYKNFNHENPMEKQAGKRCASEDSVGIHVPHIPHTSPTLFMPKGAISV